MFELGNQRSQCEAFDRLIVYKFIQFHVFIILTVIKGSEKISIISDSIFSDYSWPETSFYTLIMANMFLFSLFFPRTNIRRPSAYPHRVCPHVRCFLCWVSLSLSNESIFFWKCDQYGFKKSWIKRKNVFMFLWYSASSKTSVSWDFSGNNGMKNCW